MGSTWMAWILACAEAVAERTTPARDVEHTGVVAHAAPMFEAGAPPELRVELAPEAWEAMRTDMAAILGPFGGKGDVPEALRTACATATADAPCSVAVGPYRIDGTCRSAGDTLACARDPDLADGVPDPVPSRPIEVIGDVVFDARRYPAVGVRLKGNSTLAMAWRAGIDKLPLRLDFGTADAPERTFFGAEQVALGNGGRDATLLREHLAAETLRAFGVEAPRVGWVRLQRDVGDGPVPIGLYTYVEVPEARRLAAAFGHARGQVWEADGTYATLERWDPDAFEADGDADPGALRAAVEALAAPPEEWLASVERRWDLPTFTRWLAANTAMQNWDAYGVVPHNYYVYVGEDAVARFLPWDLNEALDASRYAPDLALSTVDARWRLIRPLLDDPDGAVAYERALDAFVATDGPFDAAFDERLEEGSARIRDAIAQEDPARSLTSPEAFEAELDELRAHVAARRAEVRAR